MEPLLDSIKNIPLKGIDWIIVGGESGRNARPMKIEWARDIMNECKKSNIPFFFKQLGGKHNKRNGSQAVIDGKRWQEYPLSNSQETMNVT